jgi:hypothetical protein
LSFAPLATAERPRFATVWHRAAGIVLFVTLRTANATILNLKETTCDH